MKKEFVAKVSLFGVRLEAPFEAFDDALRYIVGRSDGLWPTSGPRQVVEESTNRVVLRMRTFD